MRCYPFRAWSFCYLLYGKYDVSPMQVLLRRYTNLISIIIIIIIFFFFYLLLLLLLLLCYEVLRSHTHSAVYAWSSTTSHRWLTAQKCYVHFLTKLRFWYMWIARAFSHLWTKFEILIRNKNDEKWLYWSRSSNLSGCAKALCIFHSSTKVLSPASNLILRLTFLLYDM